MLSCRFWWSGLTAFFPFTCLFFWEKYKMWQQSKNHSRSLQWEQETLPREFQTKLLQYFFISINKSNLHLFLRPHRLLWVNMVGVRHHGRTSSCRAGSPYGNLLARNQKCPPMVGTHSCPQGHRYYDEICRFYSRNRIRNSAAAAGSYTTPPWLHVWRFDTCRLDTCNRGGVVSLPAAAAESRVRFPGLISKFHH